MRGADEFESGSCLRRHLSVLHPHQHHQLLRRNVANVRPASLSQRHWRRRTHLPHQTQLRRMYICRHNQHRIRCACVKNEKFVKKMRVQRITCCADAEQVILNITFRIKGTICCRYFWTFVWWKFHARLFNVSSQVWHFSDRVTNTTMELSIL